MKKTEYLVINIIFAAIFFLIGSLFLMQGAPSSGSIAWCIKLCQPHSSLAGFARVAFLPFYIAFVLFSSTVIGFYIGRFVQRQSSALGRFFFPRTVKVKIK